MGCGDAVVVVAGVECGPLGTTAVTISLATRSLGDTLSSTLDVGDTIVMWLLSPFAAGLADGATVLPTSQKDLKHFEHMALQFGLA